MWGWLGQDLKKGTVLAKTGQIFTLLLTQAREVEPLTLLVEGDAYSLQCTFPPPQYPEST